MSVVGSHLNRRRIRRKSIGFDENPPRVSVVLCTYNGEEYIKEQLESIIGQSYPVCEIIVSDDDSVDGTLDIVRALAESSPIPIRVFKNGKRLGYSNNFISACALAEGEVIALSDQDDFWFATKIERQIDAMRRSGAVLCAHDIAYMDSHGRSVQVKPRRWAHRTHVLKTGRASPWGNFKGFTVVFDRSLLGLIPAEDRGLDTHVQGDILPHDRWVYFLSTTFGSTIFLADQLARYRQHETQLFGGTDARSIRERAEWKILAGQTQARYLASVADHRAQILAASAPRPPSSEWVQARLRWLTLSQRLLASARIYEQRSFPSRCILLVKNLCRGVYTPYRFGGLGLERLLEDVAVSVAMITYKRTDADGT